MYSINIYYLYALAARDGEALVAGTQAIQGLEEEITVNGIGLGAHDIYPHFRCHY